MIYLLRHCKATGQDDTAELTSEGLAAAKNIVPVLSELNIQEIHCSTMTRAIETVRPFANEYNLSINVTEVLKERILSNNPLEDWKKVLEASFLDFDYKLENAESSNEALDRILNLVNNLDHDKQHLIVSHGNLLSLLINKFDKQFGFVKSLNMKNPDLYQLDLINQSVKQITMQLA